MAVLKKVVFLAFTYARGGAAKACTKFVQITRGFAEVKCFGVEPTGADASLGKIGGYLHLSGRCIGVALLKLMLTPNRTKHSLNLLSAPVLAAALEQAEADGVVLNVQWINNDTLGVFDLARLPPGTVLTLHDEWLYCGAEHYRPLVPECRRYIDGYRRDNANVSGFDWNRRIWRAKYDRLAPRDDLIYTVPSRWMLERARESLMLRGKDVRLVPNPVDVEAFSPLADDCRLALREDFGFDEADLVLAFGAVEVDRNPLKGFAQLSEALALLPARLDAGVLARVRLMLFGGRENSRTSHLGFRTTYAGVRRTTEEMRAVYCAADATVVPSLVESFGQVAAESLACSTPVVAFATSGLLDIVRDGETGMLARAFDPASLADRLAELIGMSAENRRSLGRRGRDWIVGRFALDVVAKQYRQVLLDAEQQRQYGAARSGDERRSPAGLDYPAVNEQTRSFEGGRRLKGECPGGTPEQPLISVITVVYNGAATLETALRSVASQRYPHVEHIVIDGGSSDGTQALLRRYDERIDYWLSEPDRGVYDAMNKGIRAASGAIIGTLNADDRYADEQCLQAVAQAFIEHRTDCIHANLNIVRADGSGRPIRRYHMPSFRKWMLRVGIMPAHPTWYCTREVYERAGLYDPTYRIAGDFEMLLRALWTHGCSLHHIDRLLVLMNDGGLSNRGFKSKFALNREIVRACRANGVYTNLGFVAAKLPVKLMQYLPR